jgi:hypothetical protein
MRIALIKNGLVETVAVANRFMTVDGYTCIDVSDQTVGTGYTYNKGVFTPPEVTLPPMHSREGELSQLQYQSLFTFEELVAIETAAETDPAIRVLQRMQQAASYISLKDARTVQGMQLLLSKGLLTQARYDEIMA